MIVCYVILRRQIYKIISNNQIKKNRFIFQNIFILEFYFLKIRIFFRLNRKTLIIILPIQQEEDYFIHLLKDCYLPKYILPK